MGLKNYINVLKKINMKIIENLKQKKSKYI